MKKRFSGNEKKAFVKIGKKDFVKMISQRGIASSFK
jgi:hypothetical protein